MKKKTAKSPAQTKGEAPKSPEAEPLATSWAGKTPTPDQWRELLEKHARWSRGDGGGQRANLRGANLQGADLQRAYLQDANLQGAYLQGAYLQRANLQGANLQGAKGKEINKFLTTPLYMLLDQKGPIRAYKLVNSDGTGPFNGGLTYRIGEIVMVQDADTDEAKDCGPGINLATLDWCMREWRPGRRILMVQFTAAEIAAIPIGSDGKFRVRRCEVVGEKDLAELGLPPEENKP